MEKYTRLDFDTQLLGVPTARLLPSHLSTEELAVLLKELKKEKIKLVYWCAAATEEHDAAVKTCHGVLTDHKLTYVADLASAPELLPKEVEFYPETEPTEALMALAYESGLHSRFKHDPHLEEKHFKAIYSTWMRNSTLRLVASDVMVIREGDNIVAMVTLGEKNNRGNIGLIAVDPSARGKGLGCLLVHAAQTYFKNQGYEQSQVVTQQINLPACRLYERCGYTQDKHEHFYHFWL